MTNFLCTLVAYRRVHPPGPNEAVVKGTFNSNDDIEIGRTGFPVGCATICSLPIMLYQAIFCLSLNCRIDI